jgi:hypothetical protein
MTLAPGSLRAHALELVRRKIAAGDFTPEDVKRWSREKDLGEELTKQLLEELAPKSEAPAKAPRSKSTPAAAGQE